MPLGAPSLLLVGHPSCASQLGTREAGTRRGQKRQRRLPGCHRPHVPPRHTPSAVQSERGRMVCVCAGAVHQHGRCGGMGRRGARLVDDVKQGWGVLEMKLDPLTPCRPVDQPSCKGQAGGELSDRQARWTRAVRRVRVRAPSSALSPRRPGRWARGGHSSDGAGERGARDGWPGWIDHARARCSSTSDCHQDRYAGACKHVRMPGTCTAAHAQLHM